MRRRVRLAPTFLSPWQRQHVEIVVSRWFARPEDRDDVAQLAYEAAFRSWRDGGFRRVGVDNRPDIYNLDLLLRSARRRFLREQRLLKDGREPEAFVIDDPGFPEPASESLGDMLDRCVSRNPKYRSRDRLWRLRALDGGGDVRLSCDDLVTLTGKRRGSVERSRRLGRAVKFFILDGKVYRRLRDIELELGITQAAARHRSRKFELHWVDRSDPRAELERQTRLYMVGRPEITPEEYDRLEEEIAARQLGAG